MLWTIFVFLSSIWSMGMLTAYTLGGLIHVLLAISVLAVLVQLIQGRKVA